MRIRHVTPALAVLALVACGEDQTAVAPTTPTAPEENVAAAPPPPPATTATAPVTPAPGAATTTAPETATAPSPTTETTGATSATGTGTTIVPPTPGADATTDQQLAAAPPPPTASGAGAGASALERYQGRELTAGPVSLRLNPDNTFVMQSEQGQQSVEGRYTFENGVLVFSDVSGDTGAADFPMRCRVEESGEGFVLRSVEDSCTRLDNLTFQPA